MGFHLDREQIKSFQKEILGWYARNRRELPWRDVPFGTSFQVATKGVSLDKRAYRVLVSEVMLQQTQVIRVIPKYEAWLDFFPTIADLAKAKTVDVLRAWSGLGYNRRALYVKRLAEGVCFQYGGIFPREENELMVLPGIGKYTARAVMCFGFNSQVAVVDTNVKKVIVTMFVKRNHFKRVDFDAQINEKSKVKSPPKGTSFTEAAQKSKLQLKSQNFSNSVISNNWINALTDKEIWEIAEKLVPMGMAYHWNQALMDYAAMMLKKEKIQIPKQSKFKGSRRYFRGQVIRQLLEKKEIEVGELGRLIKQNFVISDSIWLAGLLGELEEEGFLRVREKRVILA